MKKILFLLTGLLFMLASCSDGGSDSPDSPTPNPTPTPEETASITCSTTSLSLGYEGGEKTLSFTANKNWTISIASGISWCTISQTAGAAGTFNVSVKVSENQEYDDRNVTITIKCDNVTHNIVLTQKQKDALLITTNKYEIDKAGGSIEVEVKSNINYQIEVAEAVKNWITETNSRALTTKKHKFTIAASEEYDKREGEIYIKSGDKKETVKVYQSGGAVLVLSKKEYIISDAGETITIDIKSNFEYGIQLPSVDWISETNASRSMSSHTLKYAIAPNETYDTRSAEIIFYDKNSSLKDTVTIKQGQKDAIVLSNTEYTLTSESDTLDLEINSNVNFMIEISVDWIKQIIVSRGLETKQLHFVIDENTAEENREGIITFIYGDLKQTIKVIQDGKNIPYITFTADAPQTFTMSETVNTLEYSLNGGNWSEVGTNTILFGGDNGSLRLRGNSYMGTNGSRISFGNVTPVSCTGDIRTMINYNNYSSVSTVYAKFNSLFYGCSSLISAPKLPATELANECYAFMFGGCSSLTSAPELPATRLKESCYKAMFQSCTSLTSTPKLPATELANECYASMFWYCTSLTVAPELPAMTLRNSCYSAMFSYCTSLTVAPELPATILVEYCYASMFSHCTSLKKAPELPSMLLAKSCYNEMFSNCIRLESAPSLPATTLAEACYCQMFSGCSNITSAPNLSANILANSCYNSMFAGCSNLINAPKLPATSLANWCYGGMFAECTSLSSPPELPATNLAKGCYGEGTFLKINVGYRRVGMFSGCISLASAPILPATTLADECYSYMFMGCKKLSEVTMLATDISATNCLTEWLVNVSDTGTFIKAKEMTSLPSSTSGIPSGWTIEDYKP